MHPMFTNQLAAEHIAELHRRAELRRLVGARRPDPAAPRRGGGVLGRLPFRRPRPAAA